jgi:hypothetical protein
VRLFKCAIAEVLTLLALLVQKYYSSTNTDVRLRTRAAVYLLYWHKSTNTDVRLRA